jgi:hypothetical protein
LERGRPLPSADLIAPKTPRKRLRKAGRSLCLARSVDASVDGSAPSAARIWKAGWNATDKGELNFTPRSAETLMRDWQARGNPLACYYEHEDRLPLDKRGGAPMRGVCAAPSAELAIRQGEGGPECWAENIAWTAEAKRQIETGERRQISPIAVYDNSTREILGILNISLCAEGATHHGTLLASAGRIDGMDELKQQLMDALDAGDFETAENIVQAMEAQGSGSMDARMARYSLDKSKPAAPPPAPAPAAAPPPADGAPAVKKLAASRDLATMDLARAHDEMRAATADARRAAQQSRRATVHSIIATSRDCFDAVDEREHLTAADPDATMRFVASLKRKTEAFGRGDGAAGRGDARPPKDETKIDGSHGLDAIEIASATQMKVPLEDYAAAKKRNAEGARARGAS